MTKAPPRSTLSYANKNRPAGLYRELFYKSYEHFQAHGGLGHRKRKFRFKNKLLSLDATVIPLCLSLFPWANFRRAKEGAKVHVLLDHDTYMPVFVSITKAKRHEVNIAKTFRLNPGSIVAMDMGFTDYAMYAKWTETGVYFVTKQKDNAAFEVVDERRPPTRSRMTTRSRCCLQTARTRSRCGCAGPRCRRVTLRR